MLAARVCFWLEPPGDPPFKLCRSDWPGEAGSCCVSSFEHPTGWKPRLSSAGGPAFSCCIQEGTGQMPTLPGWTCHCGLDPKPQPQHDGRYGPPPPRAAGDAAACRAPPPSHHGLKTGLAPLWAPTT